MILSKDIEETFSILIMYGSSLDFSITRGEAMRIRRTYKFFFCADNKVKFLGKKWGSQAENAI
jgi:hypothetical protein